MGMLVKEVSIYMLHWEELGRAPARLIVGRPAKMKSQAYKEVYYLTAEGFPYTEMLLSKWDGKSSIGSPAIYKWLLQGQLPQE